MPTQSTLMWEGSTLAQVPVPPLRTAAQFSVRASSSGMAGFAFAARRATATSDRAHRVLLHRCRDGRRARCRNRRWPFCGAASSISTRLPQLFTRALFLAKTTSSSRTTVGWQFTVIVVICEAVLPVSSVTVTVAVTVLLWPCAPPSKFKRGSIEGCVGAGVVGDAAFADGPLVSQVAAASRSRCRTDRSVERYACRSC